MDTNRRQYRWRDKPAQDKTGQKFGMLTVIGFSHYELKNGKQKGRQLIWDTLCECGNTKKVDNSNLMSTAISSCGCLNKIRLEKLHMLNVKEDVAFKHLMREYIYSAQKRGYEFTLDDKQFENITQMNCYYCGIEPKQIKNKNGSHKFKNSFYIYNGIDRLDNTVGYILDNCVPCCRVCNIAKASMTKDEFLLWIKRAYTFNFKAEVAV